MPHSVITLAVGVSIQNHSCICTSGAVKCPSDLKKCNGKCSQTIHIIKSFLLSSVHRNDVQQNITTNGRHEEQRVNSYCFRGMINLLDIWTIFLKETVDTVLKNLLAFILPGDDVLSPKIIGSSVSESHHLADW